VGISSLATRKFSAFGNDQNYILIDGAVFSKDKKHLLIFITTSYPSSATAKNTRLVRMLDSVMDSVVRKSDNTISIEYFGSAAVAVGNADRLKKDIRLTLTITIILLTLIIGFSIKKKKLFPFIFLPAVFGGLTAMAVIYLIQSKISIISLSIGTVILAITVDYALHITTHYKHRHSVTKTIKDVSFPIIVCGIATAFEFISLLFVSSESLHELGILAAISIISASFFTMIVMPHILDITRSDNDETEEKNYLERILDRITNYDFHKNRVLLIFMVILTIVTLVFANRVGFESDMMKMNYYTPELARAEENLNKINNQKLSTVYVVARGDGLQDALRRNEKLVKKGNELLREGRISAFSTPGALLYSDSVQQLKIARWNRFWTDERKDDLFSAFEKAAAETGFRSNSFGEFYKMITGDYGKIDEADFNLLRNYFYSNNISTGEKGSAIVSEIKTEEFGKKDVEAELSSIPGITVMDRKSMLTGVVDTLAKDFNLIANISLILILVILIIALGRIELGVITFVPILVSWIWTLGVMSITGIKFNIFNIIISSFITGLGIDYSIYIMQGLVQGYKSNNRNLLSYKTCILISVMISLSGTGVLILARHPSLNSIALISIIGLLSVVLISYTFEPILFYWLVSKKGKKRSLPMTLTDIFFTLLTMAGGIIISIFLNLLLLLVIPLPLKSAAKRRIIHYALCYSLRVSGKLMATVKKRIINTSGEDFKKPSVIIANHTSHIDLALLLMQSPNIIVLTTKWVWNNPVYALVIRYLNFYPVNRGYEALIDKLRSKVEEGYSVLVFPEGTRSRDSEIKRFHKGAFLLAEELKVDILPIIIHGAGDCMNKGENHLKRGSVTLKIFPRVRHEDRSHGNDYHKRTKSMLGFFRSEYRKMKEDLETPAYFSRKLVRNYIFKGPVLEWYTRIKLALENNYSKIISMVPRDADVVDIGCGYGMISYMLSFTSSARRITGIDYDEDKIELAENCISKNERITFIAADACDYNYTESDVFILSDVLHYLPQEKQEQLLRTCIGKLRPGGVIIVRDADKDLQKRHLRTRWTEFFSTRFGYNKSLNRKLFFFSGKKIEEIASQFNMSVTLTESSKITSNRLYELRFRT
jgi:1-acyl-sn-glycerol-3-phosphate acyltransferase